MLHIVVPLQGKRSCERSKEQFQNSRQFDELRTQYSLTALSSLGIQPPLTARRAAWGVWVGESAPTGKSSRGVAVLSVFAGLALSIPSVLFKSLGWPSSDIAYSFTPLPLL